LKVSFNYGKCPTDCFYTNPSFTNRIGIIESKADVSNKNIFKKWKKPKARDGA